MDQFVEVLEVSVQTLEDRDKAWWQRTFGDYGRQSVNGGVSDRQADAELKQKTMYLIDGIRAVVGQRFTRSMPSR